jgi:hypothetical protein
MVLAFDFAARLGLAAATEALRVRRHFEDSGLPTHMADLAWPSPRPIA